MKLEEFKIIVSRLVARFPQAFPRDGAQAAESCKAWFEDLEEFDADVVARAAKIFWQTTEQVYPGANIGAILRNRATSTVTSATIESHLSEACQLNSSRDGNPYQYLKAISPRLLEIAERIDLFARDLTSEQRGYRVRDAAKQFIEERENEKKGFSRPAFVPTSRRLEAPVDRPEPEKQAATNKSKVQEIIKNLQEKKTL